MESDSQCQVSAQADETLQEAESLQEAQIAWPDGHHVAGVAGGGSASKCPFATLLATAGIAHTHAHTHTNTRTHEIY
jgi:hypothetical protein